jgi:chromosome segregation ATPase
MNPPDQPCQATTAGDLRQQILDSRVPKNEREWWASREIEKLERGVRALEACYNIACGEVQRFRAEVERWQTVAAQMTAEREHNANEASRLRALSDQLSDNLSAVGAAYNDEKARAEKAEAALANIANAKPHTWGDMSDSFQAWAQNRARHALAAMKGTP